MKVKGSTGLQFRGKSEGTRRNSLKKTESRHSWLRDSLHRMEHMNLVTLGSSGNGNGDGAKS